MHAASVPGSHVVLRATEEWQEPLDVAIAKMSMAKVRSTPQGGGSEGGTTLCLLLEGQGPSRRARSRQSLALATPLLGPK